MLVPNTSVQLSIFKYGAGAPVVRTPPVAEWTSVGGGVYALLIQATDVNVLYGWRMVVSPITAPDAFQAVILTGTVAVADDAEGATAAVNADAKTTIIRKIQTNRWKVDPVTKTYIIYDDGGVLPFLTFNLFDDTGAPNAYKIFERAP